MDRSLLHGFRVEPVLLRGQASFDVAQALAIAQLRKRHGAKLILAREALDVAIAMVELHAATEVVLGHMLQHPGEDEFA